MNSPFRPRAKATAFTLLELLVTIAIVGVLAGLAIPALNGAKRSSATAKSLSNFRQIGTANAQYSTDNDGQILGWGRYDNWNDDTFLMRNLNLYLSGENVSGMSADALNKIGEGLEPFIDPLVPKSSSKYTAYFPFTWAINSIFNRANGRYYQYGSSWSTVLNPRRMAEFEKAAGTIFAVSGSFELSKAKVADASLLNPVVQRPAIFYLYGKKDTTPAVFLDGHAEMLRFPIAETMVVPPAP